MTVLFCVVANEGEGKEVLDSRFSTSALEIVDYTMWSRRILSA
jgi:hypothetical protein